MKYKYWLVGLKEFTAESFDDAQALVTVFIGSYMGHSTGNNWDVILNAKTGRKEYMYNGKLIAWLAPVMNKSNPVPSTLVV